MNNIEKITKFVQDNKVVVMEKAIAVTLGMSDMYIDTRKGLYKKVESYIERHNWDDADNNLIQLNRLSDLILGWIKNHQLVNPSNRKNDWHANDVCSVYLLIRKFMYYDPEVYSYVEDSVYPCVYVGETSYDDADALLDRLNLTIPSRVAADFLKKNGFELNGWSGFTRYIMSVRKYSSNIENDYWHRGNNLNNKTFKTLVDVFNKDNVK